LFYVAMNATCFGHAVVRNEHVCFRAAHRIARMLHDVARRDVFLG